MKRYILALLAAAAIMSLAGCFNPYDRYDGPQPNEPPQEPFMADGKLTVDELLGAYNFEFESGGEQWSQVGNFISVIYQDSGTSHLAYALYPLDSGEKVVFDTYDDASGVAALHQTDSDENGEYSVDMEFTFYAEDDNIRFEGRCSKIQGESAAESWTVIGWRE